MASCEPEIKELMHQLDILISARCGELTSLLRKKEQELRFLKDALVKCESEVKQLKHAANNQEKQYRAHSADCEAQLVRLRSEVTRISQSYEQLKDKRYQQRTNKSNPDDLERLKLKLHISNEELKTATEKVTQLEQTNFVLIQKSTSDRTTTPLHSNSIATHTLEKMFDEHSDQLVLKIANLKH